MAQMVTREFSKGSKKKNKMIYSGNASGVLCFCLQKIMALNVLAKIKSTKLNEYLDKARNLKYKWLIENAEKIVQSIE